VKQKMSYDHVTYDMSQVNSHSELVLDISSYKIRFVNQLQQDC